MNVEQLVEELRFRLLQQLAPFGWAVEAEPFPMPGLAGPSALGAVFRAELIVAHPESLLRGQRFAHRFELRPELLARFDRKCLEHQIDAFARGLVSDVMAAACKAPMPTATQPDWRPAGTIPEDFYAS